MFDFAWPGIFFLLPLPLLLRWLLPAAKRDTTALNVTFLSELEAISGKTAYSTNFPKHKMIVPFIIWCALLLSAARPQWIGEPLPVEPTGRDLLMAVDTSGSMHATDMTINNKPIDRLELIKTLFGPFIENRIGDRVGLIFFGTKAYLQSPLTFDRKTVRTWLDESFIGIAGEQTAIGDGIALGVKQLYNQDEKSRVLVLFTDGSNNTGKTTPEEAMQLAKEAKVKVYTIGIGSDKLIRDVFSVYRASDDLDEEILKKIAQETGGKYFRARSEDDLAKISKALDQLEPVKQDANETRFIKEYYPWPLSLAVLLCILLVINHLFPNIKNWRPQ